MKFKAALVVLLLAVLVYAQQPVNVANIPHAIIDSGSTTAVTGNVTVQQTTGTNLHAVLDTTSTTAVTQATGTNLHAVLDTTSTTAVTQATASNLNADVNLKSVGGSAVATAATGIAKVGLTDGTGNAITSTGNKLDVNFAAGNTISLVPATSGGLTMSHTITAATDNAASVKGSAGQLYHVDVFNNAAYPIYAKFYNSASSPTSCGATNLVKVVGVQAGTGRSFDEPEGLAFSTGIGLCVIKGITNADDTATLLSDASVDLGYK